MLNDAIVLELGERLATSYAGRLLRDLGATVVLVEPTGGVTLRRTEPAYAEHLHAGKQSVTEATLPRLVGRPDVVLHDDSPTALAAVDALRAGDSAVMAVAVSNYGLDGPAAASPASELTLQAEAGICVTHVTGDRPVVQTGVDLGELSAGAAAAQAAVTALLSRDAGAQEVAADVSVFESLIGLLQYPWLYDGVEHHGEYPTPQSPVPGIERAADGWVCVVSVTGPQWSAFKKLAGVPELDDPRFDQILDRVVLSAEVTPLVRRFTARHTIAELVDLGAAHRVPIVPVGTPATMSSLPPYAARGVFVPQPSGTGVHPRPPFRAHAAPWVGEALAAVGADDDLDRLPDSAVRIPVHATATATWPLAGLRVLELGTFQAGPIVTENLAALGADVIKVEAVNRPDLIRFAGVPSTVDRFWERSAAFTAVNLGKREITADLTTEQGLDIVRRLAAESDVVLENFLPRVLDERGLDLGGLRAVNPDVLMVRMPAWGLDGPWADRPGFTYTVNAAAGVAALTGYPDGEPLLTGTIVDPFAAMVATAVTLAAIRHRVRTGRGGLVEVPLCDVAAQLSSRSVIAWSATGVAAERAGNRASGYGPRNVYECSDGVRVAIDVDEPAAWDLFAAVPFVKDWAADPVLADAAARTRVLPELDRLLTTACATLPAEEVVRSIREAGVPAAIVAVGTDHPHHPQLVARDRVIHLDHAVIGRQDYLLGAARFTAGPSTTPRASAPMFGEHSHEVLAEIGLSDDEVEALVTAKLIGDSPFGLPFAGRP
ncbi:CoA transferase [Nocardioides sp.]|uniref:CoA transferase n=1 Tax=Nocardioides sp. TaxID=35761 RepID=UPI00262CD444|nr:CoA transferase [Nocardioides sp.]